MRIGMAALGMSGSGGPVAPNDFMAPVLLDVDGGRLTEHDGPTKMWTAFDSMGGLAMLWPDLPSGTTGTWQVPQRNPMDAAEVEVRRGQSRLPPGVAIPPVGEPRLLAVQTRWKSADTLTGTWSVSGSDAGDVALDGENVSISGSSAATGEGTWVIRDGTLETATVHQAGTLQMGMSGGSVPAGLAMEQEQTLDLTASRVDVCSISAQTSFP